MSTAEGFGSELPTRGPGGLLGIFSIERKRNRRSANRCDDEELLAAVFLVSSLSGPTRRSGYSVYQCSTSASSNCPGSIDAASTSIPSANTHTARLHPLCAANATNHPGEAGVSQTRGSRTLKCVQLGVRGLGKTALRVGSIKTTHKKRKKPY